MLEFAEQTGAGGFSFDLTYWEEGLPVASEYAQWSGWRNILSQLHTKRGGLGCASSRCVVDNRQANHAWGAWMWALGGTCKDPLTLALRDCSNPPSLNQHPAAALELTVATVLPPLPRAQMPSR